MLTNKWLIKAFLIFKKKLNLVISFFLVIAFNIQYVSAYNYKYDKYYDYDKISDYYMSLANTPPIFHSDTIDDVILKLSHDDPDVTKVLRKLVRLIMKTRPEILKPLMAMRAFNYLGITGSKILMLHENVCQKDIMCVYACIWSVLTRNLPKEILYFAIENRGEGINLISLLETFDKEISNVIIHEIAYGLLAVVSVTFIILKIITFAVESDARRRVNYAILRNDFYR